MRPIPPDALGTEDQNKVLEFLKEHYIGVLASVTEEGEPHASAIYFTVYEDLSFSFTTKRSTQKYKNISANPKIMLAVYDGKTQTAVQLGGTAVEVTGEAELQSIYAGTLRATKATSDDIVPPIAKISGMYVAYKVSPDTIRYSEYGWGDNFKNALRQSMGSDYTNDPS